jgi:hypothetical protein
MKDNKKKFHRRPLLGGKGTANACHQRAAEADDADAFGNERKWKAGGGQRHKKKSYPEPLTEAPRKRWREAVPWPRAFLSGKSN